MPLPTEFLDLAPYESWALATEPERYARRLASSMEEMQVFYDAAFPRLQDALDHCGDQAPEDLSEEDRQLLLLMMSLVMVSFPVEVWKQPRVPDSGAAYLDLIHEPLV